MRILAFLTWCLVVIPSLANEKNTNKDQGNFIEVIGEAAIKITPKVIHIDFILNDRSVNIAKSKMLVEQKSKQFLQVVKNSGSHSGIKPDDIQWGEISIRPLYIGMDINEDIRVQGVEVPHTFYPGGQGKVFISTEQRNLKEDIDEFEVSRTVTLGFANVDAYHQLLEKVIKINVASISPTPLSRSDFQRYYQQALDEAVLNARNKAQIIAGQTGSTIEKLNFIREIPLYEENNVKENYSSGSAIFSGKIKQEIRARLIASFLIKP